MGVTSDGDCAGTAERSAPRTPANACAGFRARPWRARVGSLRGFASCCGAAECRCGKRGFVGTEGTADGREERDGTDGKRGREKGGAFKRRNERVATAPLAGWAGLKYGGNTGPVDSE